MPNIALTAVADAATDLAAAIRNMLDDQAEPEPTATEAVLAHVLDERRRQDVKWGEQNHSDGTGPDIRWQPGIQSTATAAVLADEFRRRCQANDPGEDTWRDILLEEVAEALAEDDPAKLRAELVQVAAVAVQWIEAIDRRRAHTPSATPTAEACTPECERVARRHLVHARSAHRDDIGAEVGAMSDLREDHEDWCPAKHLDAHLARIEAEQAERDAVRSAMDAGREVTS